jgi:hypothetical protein
LAKRREEHTVVYASDTTVSSYAARGGFTEKNREMPLEIKNARTYQVSRIQKLEVRMLKNKGIRLFLNPDS